MKRDAVISKCGKYRYSLIREWNKSKQKVLFLMLNPSDADDKKDDPTIKRCINFAKDWGYGGLMVANLYAYITDNPKELFTSKNPEGFDNIRYIKKMINECKIVVCAWGNKQGLPPLYLQKLSDLYFLELSDVDGTPKHPLYLNKTSKLRKFKFNNKLR